MFNNYIKGKNNKIKIKQTKGELYNISTEIIIGIIISVVGGFILFLLTGR